MSSCCGTKPTTIHINHILERETIENTIIQLLQSFDDNCHNIQFKRGIYIYGSSGTGKTFFITEILKKLNYDVIKYDAGDTRNKSLIDSITNNNISSNNVINMMYKKKQKIAILMDEIEAMNSGDKWGITSLIKLIRQKKTKRQKMENQTYNPIICISNYYIDKKIKELMKVCHVFELKTPTIMQIFRIIQTIPQIAEKTTEEEKQQIVEYSQGDLRKCFSVTKYADIASCLKTFRLKTFNEDSKIITKRLLQNKVRIEEHNMTINETERTIIALLWHENVVDYINRSPSSTLSKIQLYHKILKNICFADYIDRITFQNQIWQFNEMSSLIKTMYNNKIYHESMVMTTPCNDLETAMKQEIRFTKILTKYSTEYNNANFVYSLCNKMDMDRKDIICFFQEMRILKSFAKNDLVQQEMLNRAEITSLDVKRFYRYLDQNDKREESSMVEEEIMENEENMEEISCYDFI